MKLKAFTPTALKGDLAFISSLVAVFGWSIPTPISIAIVTSGALICIVLNGAEKFAEAHIHVGAHLSATLATGLADIKALLPDITSALAAVPGQVAAEIKKALETVEEKPASTETVVRETGSASATKGGGTTGKTK